MIPEIDNTVIDDDLLNAVQHMFVGKTVPRREAYQVAAAERVQIMLNGFISQCKDCVVSARREQLTERC